MQTIEGKGTSVRWKVPAILNHYYPINRKINFMELDNIYQIKDQLRSMGIDPEVLAKNDLTPEALFFDVCDQMTFEEEVVLKVHLHFFKSTESQDRCW